MLRADTVTETGSQMVAAGGEGPEGLGLLTKVVICLEGG